MNKRFEQNISDGIVLETKNLSKQVSSPEGRLTILDDVTIQITSGESIALVGPSGAGKTTLLALLAGLDRPTTGSVRLCGEDLTAMENVMLPLELAGASSSGAAERAKEALVSVGLERRTTHYPKQLSGGEKQRVAIARAFVTGPSILFADEPTGNLDTASGDRVTDLLFSLNEQSNTTLVLVTHDRELAKRCDRIIELEAGRML
jgi:putative ABC transport system ATP-binding protein